MLWGMRDRNSGRARSSKTDCLCARHLRRAATSQLVLPALPTCAALELHHTLLSDSCLIYLN